MKFLENSLNIKYVLVVVAIVIAIASLLTSNYLIKDLQDEEKKSMKVWAEAMRSLNDADENTDMNLILQVINGNTKIPVIIADQNGEAISSRNINITFSEDEDSLLYLTQLAKTFVNKGQVIKIDLPDDLGEQGFINICYDESLMLKRLSIYPYIQLGVVSLFVLISIFALFAAMKAEQNKVWVGLSKETAHQLGTPISSLMAWSEVLKETYPDDVLLPEMEKDIKRLERIAERFSKIGSIPEPKPEDVKDVLERVVTYMDKRTSSKVIITTHFPDEPVIANLISSLFEWVAENLCKNAVDAMGGSGKIDVYLDEDDTTVFVEVTDTGKGIAKSHFQSVFKPGFTTKERGWGLGLSLAKRIVEEYHKGKIYVKNSEINVGTTFRIELSKVNQ
ncbi:MAG: HAMP domain-containing histidine kinase [Prevotellaceae bacterium]|nr:HAMP domain-containing histidine kinase [Candidatus Minthosoma equi]